MTLNLPLVRLVFAVFAIVDYASDRRVPALYAVGVLLLMTAFEACWRDGQAIRRAKEARA